jgi:hypothetical protein
MTLGQKTLGQMTLRQPWGAASYHVTARRRAVLGEASKKAADSMLLLACLALARSCTVSWKPSEGPPHLGPSSPFPVMALAWGQPG